MICCPPGFLFELLLNFKLNSDAFNQTIFCFCGCFSLLVWLIAGECSMPGLILGEREMLEDLCWSAAWIRLPKDACAPLGAPVPLYRFGSNIQPPPLPLEFIGEGDGPLPTTSRIFFLYCRFDAFLSLFVMFRRGNELSFSKLDSDEGATCWWCYTLPGLACMFIDQPQWEPYEYWWDQKNFPFEKSEVICDYWVAVVFAVGCDLTSILVYGFDLDPGA